MHNASVLAALIVATTDKRKRRVLEILTRIIKGQSPELIANACSCEVQAVYNTVHRYREPLRHYLTMYKEDK